MAKSENPESFANTNLDLPQKTDYVYSLHGIRTNAFWHAQIADELRRALPNFEVGYRNYLRFDLLMFVLKNMFFHKPLRIIEDDLRNLTRIYRVSVIAHSFGTWLILKALSENSDLKIHHVILCGGIFPRASAHWRRFKHDSSQITGDIVNFCGLRDPFPALAEMLSRDFGASGVVGAGDPVIRDSYHDMGHSGFLTKSFCRDFWIPILLATPPKKSDQSRPRAYILGLLWASAHRGILVTLIVASIISAVILYRSELSCSIRDCYVDVVRIHNYTGSTRVAGPRRYVNQIIFQYTLNYDAHEILFRAPADRRPTVVSFLGDQLTPLSPRETADAITTADGVAPRRWWAFRLPVLDRRAYFSAEFANDSDEMPEGFSAFSIRKIRDLRGEIVLPNGVSLVPPRTEFRKGLLINKVPNDELAKRCEFSTDGMSVHCKALNLPEDSEFFYCFTVSNWDQMGGKAQTQVDGCRPK